MLDLRIHSVVLWFVSLVIVSIADSRCFAVEPRGASVEIVVTAEPSILGEQERGSLGHLDDKKLSLEPCKSIFIYMEPTTSRALSKRPELRDLILERASHRQPASREFEEADGKIVPPAMIVQVGDSVSHSAGGRPIRFEVFKNDVYGITVPSFKFKEPESVPIKVVDPLESFTGAYLLVLDHEIAALTDDRGVARFNELPVGFELPMRIFYPHRPTASVSFRSESLEIDRAGRFLLRIDEASPQRHEVTILAGEGK